jgi:hypothetical protein
MDFVPEVRQWFEAIAAAKRDGFEFGYGEGGYLLGLGSNLHFFEYGEDIITARGRRGACAAGDRTGTGARLEFTPAAAEPYLPPKAWANSTIEQRKQRIN